MVSNSTVSYRKIVGERKHQFMQQTSLLSYFKKLPQTPQPPANSSLISHQPSISRQDPPSAKRLSFAEESDDRQHLFFFLAIKPFNIKVYTFFQTQCYCRLLHTIDYSTVETEFLGKPKKLMFFTVGSPLLQPSGAEPVYPRWPLQT